MLGMLGQLIPLLSGSVIVSVCSAAMQLMVPVVIKAIIICLVAALPVGGGLGFLTGEFIRRAIGSNKREAKFHLFNVLIGAVGFLFGAFIGLRVHFPGSMLFLAILSSVALVLVVRLFTYTFPGPAKIRK
jgi:hypothetical protein